MQHDIFYYGGSDYQRCVGDISDWLGDVKRRVIV